MTAWQRAYGRSAAWFLLPAVVLLGTFAIWPLLRALYFSVHDTEFHRRPKGHAGAVI